MLTDKMIKAGIEEYKVVDTISITELNTKGQELIEKDYIPLGGVAITVDSHDIFYAQAFIKLLDDSDDNT